MILALLASKASFAMGAGIVGLLAVLSTEEFGGGDASTGLLLGARGVGVALGPLHRVAPDRPRPVTRAASCAVAPSLVFGVCYLGLAVSTALWMGLVLVFVAHLGGGAQWTLSTYGLQARAPDSIRGRILAGDVGFTMLDHHLVEHRRRRARRNRRTAHRDRHLRDRWGWPRVRCT